MSRLTQTLPARQRARLPAIDQTWGGFAQGQAATGGDDPAHRRADLDAVLQAIAAERAPASERREERERMVREQIEARGVTDPLVLEAMREQPDETKRLFRGFLAFRIRHSGREHLEEIAPRDVAEATLAAMEENDVD